MSPIRRESDIPIKLNEYTKITHSDSSKQDFGN